MDLQLQLQLRFLCQGPGEDLTHTTHGLASKWIAFYMYIARLYPRQVLPYPRFFPPPPPPPLPVSRTFSPYSHPSLPMDAPLHLSLEFDQHLLRNTSSPLPSPSTAGPPFECRICQEEEDEFSPLETPCACSGSLRYAHRKCIQRWCNEKGNTICEVCQQPYQHGYIAPQSREQQNITIELSEWGIRDLGTFQVHHPRILALAAAERHLLASDYEEYVAVSSSAFFCRSVALLLMVLLLFRYGLDLAVTAEDGDPSMILMIFLLRLVGFFLPCYIIIQAMNMLQQSQQMVGIDMYIP